MPPDPPSGSRLQHLRVPPLILPLLRHCKMNSEKDPKYIYAQEHKLITIIVTLVGTEKIKTTKKK